MFSPITTEPPTEQQLAEIRARREAITDAPWGSRGDLDGRQTVQAGAWVTMTEGFASTGDVANVLGDTDEQRYRRANFISQAPYDIDRLHAEVDRLRARVAELERAQREIRALHIDSVIGPCPTCFDADDYVAGGDGLVPWPCPTARLAGAEPCDPPHMVGEGR